MGKGRRASCPSQGCPDYRGHDDGCHERSNLPGEEWRAIPGWEGRYEVSNMGRVYSVRQPATPKSGRLLKTRVKKSGHLHLELTRDGKGKQFFVHHLVLTAFVGPRPDGLECCHNNGDPADNRVGNLRWDTRSANQQDRWRDSQRRQNPPTEVAA